MEKGNYDEGFGLEQHKDKWGSKGKSNGSLNQVGVANPVAAEEASAKTPAETINDNGHDLSDEEVAQSPAPVEPELNGHATNGFHDNNDEPLSIEQPHFDDQSQIVKPLNGGPDLISVEE